MELGLLSIEDVREAAAAHPLPDITCHDDLRLIFLWRETHIVDHLERRRQRLEYLGDAYLHVYASRMAYDKDCCLDQAKLSVSFSQLSRHP
jgi:hypothetical protein